MKHVCLALVSIGMLLAISASSCRQEEEEEEQVEYEVFAEIGSAHPVDILLMVDNSNSMDQEQAVLREQIVIMLQELTSPASGDASPVEDLHVGVVSSDMGTGGYTIQTCDNAASGDGGVLQNTDHDVIAGCRSSYSAPGCGDSECPWLAHSSEYPDDISAESPIWQDFGCVATLGTGGCGFEQQLESTLAALTTQAGPGMPNEGFLRDDSLLAIIYVTDEDDCSTGNPEMFDPARDDYGGLNVRCALNPDELYPISRYQDAFLDLRGGDLNRIVVAAITGVPVDGSWNPGDPLEQLREMQRVEPSNPNELMKSCDTAMGVAFPPVRIAELIYSFGNNGLLESICRQDWTPALQAITRMIQEATSSSACLSSLVPGLDPTACRVVETLTDDRPCPDLAEGEGADRVAGSHVDLGLDDAGRRLCEVLLADYDDDGCPDGAARCSGEVFDDPGTLQGWFLDTTAPECEFGLVRFTRPELIDGSSDVRFECPW